MSNYYNAVIDVLKQDNRFFSDEGDFLRNAVYEAAMQMDSKLIKSLYDNKATRERFFTEVDGIAVFDKVGFGWVINNREFLPDCYTRYKNKIGLVNNHGEYISTSNDVVLAFPYKDCVLEGGQTKEDQKRNEIFYNETLAPDEVDRLLYPKVFTRAIRYTPNHEEEITNISDSDNLIIKGNNLLSIMSLNKRFAKKIKMVYWDIPYNTGSDSFGYNDSFNRSTWLVFIKNRVNATKPLLKDDGVILFQCSFHQYSYLKVLLDEIMGSENYKMTLNLLVRHPERTLTGDKEFNDVVEYILVYSKIKSYRLPKKCIRKSNDEYVYQINILSEGEDVIFKGKRGKIYLPENYNVVKCKPDENNFKTVSVRGSIKEKNSSGRFYVKYLQPLVDKYPSGTLFRIDDIGDDVYPYRYFQLPVNGNKNGIYFQGKPTSSEVTYKPFPNFLDVVAPYNVVNDEGSVEFRNGKKPEELLKYLIDIFTEQNDYILDAFVGSGTTASTAIKMNRKFIGVEQMDYINNITLERLVSVIRGKDDTGISKQVNWKGGGSFVYCELAKLNQKYVENIQEATDDKTLDRIWSEMQNTGFINSYVDPKQINPQAEDFRLLPLEDKKRLLMELLDKNQLYVNLCDIDDEEFGISDVDKEFNRSFYREAK